MHVDTIIEACSDIIIVLHYNVVFSILLIDALKGEEETLFLYTGFCAFKGETKAYLRVIKLNYDDLERQNPHNHLKNQHKVL